MITNVFILYTDVQCIFLYVYLQMKIKGITFVLIKFICIFHYEGTDSTTYTRREVNKC